MREISKLDEREVRDRFKITSTITGRHILQGTGCRLKGCRLKFNYNWKTVGTKNN